MAFKQYRWTEIELEILRKAYDQGISLKVIGHAFDRSLSAVNKALARKGIRPNPGRPGRKPNQELLPQGTLLRSTQDRVLMNHIMQAYDLPPLKNSLRTRQAHHQKLPPASHYKKEKSLFLLNIQKLEKSEKSRQKTRLFVSASIVEKWARLSELPFTKTKSSKARITYHYKLNGVPLTALQFLLAVNRRRISEGALPFCVEEWLG